MPVKLSNRSLEVTPHPLFDSGYPFTYRPIYEPILDKVYVGVKGSPLENWGYLWYTMRPNEFSHDLYYRRVFFPLDTVGPYMGQDLPDKSVIETFDWDTDANGDKIYWEKATVTECEIIDDEPAVNPDFPQSDLGTEEPTTPVEPTNPTPVDPTDPVDPIDTAGPSDSGEMTPPPSDTSSQLPILEDVVDVVGADYLLNGIPLHLADRSFTVGDKVVSFDSNANLITHDDALKLVSRTAKVGVKDSPLERWAIIEYKFELADNILAGKYTYREFLISLIGESKFPSDEDLGNFGWEEDENGNPIYFTETTFEKIEPTDDPQSTPADNPQSTPVEPEPTTPTDTPQSSPTGSEKPQSGDTLSDTPQSVPVNEPKTDGKQKTSNVDNPQSVKVNPQNGKTDSLAKTGAETVGLFSAIAAFLLGGIALSGGRKLVK